MSFNNKKTKRSNYILSAGENTRDNLVIQDMIGPYKIIKYLAKGGMGLIYEAEDSEGVMIALKTIIEHPGMPSTTIERFLREAKSAKQLRNHPNIITVYDTGSVETTHYIAMELIPKGRSLEDLIEQKTLSQNEVLNIALKIAEGLSFAHSNGIIHRDIKPANILINDFGEPLISDFGLAKPLNSSVNLTLSGIALGTPKYMAPSQIVGENADVQTDIYSFGLVLYELATGFFPYEMSEGVNFVQILQILTKTKHIAPRKLNKKISKNFEAVILVAIERDKKYRYKTMDALVQDIKACLNNNSVSVRKPSLGEKMDRYVWRYKKVFFLTLLILTSVFFLIKKQKKDLTRERSEIWFKDMKIVSRDKKIENLLERLEHKGANKREEEELFESARKDIINFREEKAMEKYKKILSIATEKNYFAIELFVQKEIARLYLGKKQYDKAFDYYNVILKGLSEDDARRSLMEFEKAITLNLAGKKEIAFEIWEELSRKQNLQIRLLAEIALKKRTPEKLSYFKKLPPATQALALWLTITNSELSETEREKIKKRVSDIAKESIPWLYYYLNQ
ncbi:MAG: serine/threonine-protein kinase [Verrucomicrobiota bacterium]|nr:serine/threonine-protein kinase [Verrucomicrobiota bacterium]